MKQPTSTAPGPSVMQKPAFNPFFSDTVVALDGTHIRVSAPEFLRPCYRHRNRPDNERHGRIHFRPAILLRSSLTGGLAPNSTVLKGCPAARLGDPRRPLLPRGCGISFDQRPAHIVPWRASSLKGVGEKRPPVSESASRKVRDRDVQHSRRI